MTPIQAAYARLVKVAETELCKSCDKEPITDIWHSMCHQCSIYAEQAAYDSSTSSKNEVERE